MSDSVGSYDQSMAILIIVLNCISMLALGLVLLVYIINWKTIASFSMRLSFYLCLACLGQNITVILLNPITIHETEISNGVSTSTFCIFQGILKVTFDLSSIIWTTLIIYSVYASVVLQAKLQKWQIMYIFTGFCVPFGAACIPLIFQAYRFDDYYCWFSSPFNAQGFWLRFGYFFLPLWVLFIVNMVFAFLTFERLRKISMPKEILKVFQRLLLFPLILLVTGAFATADIIYDYSTKQNLAWLNNTGLFFLNLYGIFNAIAYGLNPIVKDRIKLCLTKNSEVEFRSEHLSLPTNRTSSMNSQRIKQQIMQLTTMKKAASLPLKLQN